MLNENKTYVDILLSLCCVAAYDPFELMNHLTNFHKVLYEGHPDFLQPVIKWWTHELVR
jgi:hypothetical protein